MDLTHLIDTLRGYTTEQSWFEFKSDHLEPHRMGQIISGIHNYIYLYDISVGYIIYGIHDSYPHEPTGTSLTKENLRNTQGTELSVYLMNKLYPSLFFEFQNINYQGKNLFLVTIKNNWKEPVLFDDKLYFRMGQSNMEVSKERVSLKIELYTKAKKTIPFEKQIVAENIPFKTIFDSLLLWGAFYELKYSGKIPIPYPKIYPELIKDFVDRGFIVETEPDKCYSITCLGALLFAKDLSKFESLNNRRIRIVEYEGIDKQTVKKDGDYTTFTGYANSFDKTIQYIMDKVSPKVQNVGAQKIPVSAYPVIALREFIANALVHQDFSVTGMSPAIYIYSNRIEVTNPGLPEIDIDRFIDENKARNEILVDRMRELHLCEMQGSGIDNALLQIGFAHLPAPKFSSGDIQFSVAIFAPQEFEKMDKNDRMRICFQHCVLQWVISEKMTNETLRKRLGFEDNKSSVVSKIISDTLELGQIKELDVTASNKFKSYVPYWHQ